MAHCIDVTTNKTTISSGLTRKWQQQTTSKETDVQKKHPEKKCNNNKKNSRTNAHKPAFMKQVEKDQRSSNEFSMRLEITALFFSASNVLRSLFVETFSSFAWIKSPFRLQSLRLSLIVCLFMLCCCSISIVFTLHSFSNAELFSSFSWTQVLINWRRKKNHIVRNIQWVIFFFEKKCRINDAQFRSIIE